MQITKSAIIYDCETARCILKKGEERDPNLAYCEGWTDWEGMGVACICAWDYEIEQMRVFTGENLGDFATLVADREHIIGFNSIAFDDRLCQAQGLSVTTTYDMQVEVWKSLGQPSQYTHGVTRKGLGLNDLALVNFGIAKTGEGGDAPKLWQLGHRDEVIGYCQNDVLLTKRLLESWGHLKEPDSVEKRGGTFALHCPPMWDEWDGFQE